MAKGSCLYVGRGCTLFRRDGVQRAVGAQDRPLLPFSAPPTRHTRDIGRGRQGNVRELGDPLTSNRRTLNQYTTRRASTAARSSWASPRCTRKHVEHHARHTTTAVPMLPLFDLPPTPASSTSWVNRPEPTTSWSVTARQSSPQAGQARRRRIGQLLISVGPWPEENQSFADMDGSRSRYANDPGPVAELL